LLATLTFLPLLAGTVAAMNVSRTLTSGLEENRFNAYTSAVSTGLNEMLRQYVDRLHALKAFVEASEGVNASSFATFVRASGTTELAGIQAVGSARRVGAADRASFEVEFVVPLAGHEADLGLDLSFEAERGVAIQQAIDTGDAVATSSLAPGQDARPRAEFLLLLAVYRGAASTLEERRDNLAGLVVSVHRTEDVIALLLARLKPTLGDVQLAVYDARRPDADAAMDLDAEAPIFNTTNFSAPRGGLPPNEGRTVRVEVGGGAWAIVVNKPEGLLSTSERSIAWIAIIVGGVINVLLTGIVYLTTTSQARAQETAERMTASYRRTERKFRDLLESAPDGILIVDATGRIVMANAQIETLFGYARQEVTGQPVEMLIPERFRGEHVQHRTGFFHTPVPRQMGAGLELFGLRKDGTEFPVEISLGPLKTDEGPVVSAAIRDVTARKEVEAEIISSLHEKEALLREIHHRVKNNLQVISSLLALQSDSADDPLAKPLFEESRDRVKSMALVHEKLYQSPNLSRIDFGEYVRDLVSYLLRSYGALGRIEAHVQIESVMLQLDAAINCGLIINELVSNALKHAFPENKAGSIRIHIRRDEQGIALFVEDDGIGFPPGVDFQHTKTMGLRLVVRLVRQLNATIRLDGRMGTVFRIDLPGSAIVTEMRPSSNPGS